MSFLHGKPPISAKDKPQALCETADISYYTAFCLNTRIFKGTMDEYTEDKR
jgi:hypothetical protein